MKTNSLNLTKPSGSSSRRPLLPKKAEKKGEGGFWSGLWNHLTRIPLVGVDLGSAVLKAVEIECVNGKIVLSRAVIRARESGNDSAFVKRILKEAGIRAVQASVGLASPEVIARPFHFPRMPKKELERAVQIEAEQAILNGHSFSEIVMDWHLLPDSSEGVVRGLLAVVPCSVIQTRLQTLKSAGLSPRVVDVEGLALWNAYWALLGSREPSVKTVLLVNVGAETTNLVIARGSNELVLVRDLQVGVNSLVKDEGRDWTTEIQDSLGYARSKNGLRALDTVYVTGGGSGSNAVSLLKNLIEAPILIWNPLDQIELRPAGRPIERSAGPLLTVAIGLALRRPS